MEDGSNGISTEADEPDHAQNGLGSPIMANFPSQDEETPISKINGDADESNDDCSSESDALVIDEALPSKKKKPHEAVIPHFNPYFNESLFELSQQHQPKTKRPKSKNPKLREYAQYLGLQPKVQFRCSKCGRAGFESLTTLNEHIVQCTDEPTTTTPVQPQDNPASSFKLTRKVFLCSACGTYYENWNLYLHMLEVHRRYLCLYCLGMFSVLDDLCMHIQSRHNLEPGHKDNLEEFFSAYSDPCYIVCCECNKLFNEQDNFFYHTCSRKDQKSNKTANNNQKVVGKQASKGAVKQLIRPEDHVTGDAPIGNGLDSDHNQATSDVVNGHLTDDIADRKSLIEEILYSSDSELNFKGFDEDGEAVFLNKQKDECVVDNLPEEEVQLEEEMMGEPVVEEAEDESMEIVEEPSEEEPLETRKVPKLSLKLKPGSFPEIEQQPEQVNLDDNSETFLHSDQNDVEQIESENEVNNASVDDDDDDEDNKLEISVPEEPEMQIAGPDISIVELELEQPLDKFDIRILLQKCLKATAPFCIYCNHARKIAVNGKQLGLHAIAEHRFSAVVSSITAEELIPESFVARIKESLPSMEQVFFSLESNPSDEAVTFSHIFECFQCRYSTTVHKELYLHNRKLHAKNLLLCIMCKSNFYSYSELICHLCPGVYILDYDVQFRCCMCVSDELPSAFRLMVHLRKRHHVCDVCLEMCHNQYRLSNHVWKHKLHHFCYRCGIAYRNKPDITRHLFWKHGTESVLCKKCLQKKWPHVYHFCVPPTSFLCEECNLTFARAVSLKVHKRIHSDEKPHSCTIDGCSERFISKKLLAKHERKHREPPEEVEVEEKEPVPDAEVKIEDDSSKNEEVKCQEEKVKPKVDVYDLPALNLSESDSSDSESELTKKPEPVTTKEEEIITEDILEAIDKELNEEIVTENNIETLKVEETTNHDSNDVVLENIWDDFKNYQASKEKFDNLFTECDKTDPTVPESSSTAIEEPLTLELALRDHDYCIDPEHKPDVSYTEVKPDLSQSVDHDYCSATNKDPTGAKEKETETKPSSTISAEPKTTSKKSANSSSSDSSSDSDSSCSCGPNCSCSSSSGSSSSSSDSSNSDSSTEEGRKRQQLRRERRRQKKKGVVEADVKIDVVTNDQVPIVLDTPIQESDLETTESETDEEFYDKQPQKMAKKILEEKRNQLLAGIEQVPNGSFLENSRPATPHLPDEEEHKPKKKSKSKKKKKKKSERKEMEQKEFNTANIPPPYYHQYYQPPTVAPITLTLSRNSPVPSPSAKLPPTSLLFPKSEAEMPREDSDINLRASKRRRVPNKFYGYSSDEEDEKATTTPKWRKSESMPLPQHQQHSSMVVPPITIKTGPPPVPPFSIRTTHPGQMKVQQPHRKIPTIKLKQKVEDGDSEAESNDSSNEGRNMLQVNPDALYCYCKCPYDEVSEMIGCDSRDCEIEWFHFECVGIMVPPKGHWYCPECRKKRQQKREMLKLKAKT